jgi:hypothetical protein
VEKKGIDDQRKISKSDVCQLPSSIPNPNTDVVEAGDKSPQMPVGVVAVAIILALSGIVYLSQGFFFVFSLLWFPSTLFEIFLETFYLGAGLAMLVSGWGLGRVKKWGLLGTAVLYMIIVALVILDPIIGYIRLVDPLYGTILTADPFERATYVLFNIGIIVYLALPETRKQFA